MEVTGGPGHEFNTPTLSTKNIYIPIITGQPTQNNQPMNRDDELRNQDEPLPLLPEAYDPSFSFEVRGYPDSLGFILCNMLGRTTNYTATVGDGVITDQQATTIPTGAYRHRWTAPFGPTGLNPLTAQYQFGYADESTFIRAKGAAIHTLALDSPEKGGVRVKPAGDALYVNTVSDPGLSPAYESYTLRPFERAGLTLPTWLASTAVHQDFTVSIAAPTMMTHSLGNASKFPDLMEKGDGLITFTGSLPQRQLNQVDWNAMRDNTGFSALAYWKSDTIIASGYPYKMYINMTNCQYEGGEADPLTNARRIGANFTWRATNAGSASVVVELVSATTSYA